MSRLLERSLLLVSGFCIGAFVASQMNFHKMSEALEQNGNKEIASLKMKQVEQKSVLKVKSQLKEIDRIDATSSELAQDNSHTHNPSAEEESHGHAHSSNKGVHNHHAMANQLDELDSQHVSIEQEAFQSQMRNVIDLSYRIVTIKPDPDNQVSWEDAEYFVQHTLGNSALDSLDMTEVERIATGLNTQKKRHEFYNLLLNKIAPEGMSFAPAVTYSN